MQWIIMMDSNHVMDNIYTCLLFQTKIKTSTCVKWTLTGLSSVKLSASSGPASLAMDDAWPVAEAGVSWQHITQEMWEYSPDL